MTNCILTSFPLDDDRPERPDPKEDELKSAQSKRFYRSLQDDDDYDYSD